MVVAFLHRNSIYDLLYAAVNYYYGAPVSPFTTAGYRLDGRGVVVVVVVPRNGRGPSAVALPSRNMFYYTGNVIPVNLRISRLYVTVRYETPRDVTHRPRATVIAVSSSARRNYNYSCRTISSDVYA